jgi:transmembrane sensor
MSHQPEREPTDRSAEASDWCLRIAERKLTAEESHAFQTWMETDPANRDAFDRATFIWRAFDGRAAPRELVDIRMDALGALHEAPEDKRSGRSRMSAWKVPSALAASVVLMLAASLMFFSDNVIRYETGIGERRVVMLEDGSRLSLDAASRIEVDYSRERRDLRLLAGRARFDVAADPLRPFSVAASDKLIVATGTSFSVELLNRRVEVVLFEGHVSVLRTTADGTPQPVALAPNVPLSQALRPGTQAALAEDGPGAALAPVDPPRAMAWEGGQLSFNEEPLGRAVERMNRYSRTPIVVGDAAAARLPINGVFNADDPDSFVEGVTGVFPIRSVREGSRVVLRSKRE